MVYSRSNLSKVVACGSATLLGLSSFALGAAPTLAQGGEAGSDKNFTVQLQPLNSSGVTGTATVTLRGKQLVVDIDAVGLQPNVVHPAHIHGMLNGEDATCPTMAQDTNHDGFISVFEGAPTYGAIKVNLTKPQTPFGPNPTAALFAPFAGVPSLSNFPKATQDGSEHFMQTYAFNLSDADAAAAFKGVMPLSAQEIVLHGAMAPESVDTMGGDPSKMVYDGLLPVACGDLRQAMKDEHGVGVMDTSQTMTMADMNMSDMSTPDMSTLGMVLSNDANLNRDQVISHAYEVRNQIIDRLNRTGNVMARDTFLYASDKAIDAYANHSMR